MIKNRKHETQRQIYRNLNLLHTTSICSVIFYDSINHNRVFMYVYLTTEIKGLQITPDKKYRILENDSEYFKIQADDKPRWFKWGAYPWNIYEPTPIYQTQELVDLLDQIKSYQDAEPFLTEFETECYKGLLVKLNEYLQKAR